MNVILSHSDHRYVSATHVTIFRVAGMNKNANIITMSNLGFISNLMH